MRYILPFNKIDRDDADVVGTKAANLGELVQAAIPVPPGFVVTTKAYFDFLALTGLQDKIHKLLENLNAQEQTKLEEVSSLIRKAIIRTAIPKEIENEIRQSYKDLGKGKRVYVAVRSSVAGDSGDGSMFDMQGSFLNVRGADAVAAYVKEVWAAQFNSRAIYYRAHKRTDHLRAGMAVPIQLMVEADASGVAFSVDPISNDKTKIVVEAIYGLGKMLGHGAVSPDYFEFDKATLEMTYSQIGIQDKQMVKVDGKNKEIAVSKAYMAKQKVGDRVLKEVAKYTRDLGEHYAQPQDVEWAWDGKKLFVLETRAVVAAAQKVKVESSIRLPFVLKGAPGSSGIASGKAVLARSLRDLAKIGKGDVLVAEKWVAEYGPSMRNLAAIVTDKGGRTAQVAMLSRELGIPAVVGAVSATKELKEGQVYTINGSSGEVFSGRFTARARKIPYEAPPSIPQAPAALKTATKIMVNLEDPSVAVTMAAKNVDGVGLLRSELMMKQIGVHPKQAIKSKQEKEYVQMLAEGIAKFCEAFGDRPVIYRAADFKSSEYRDLEGGEEFEIYEENPMLGYRGAARHIKEPEVFGLELEAIKKVRNVHGHKNLHLLVPFVRSPKELAAIKMLIAAAGLHRGVNFKLYMMARAPSNVLRLPDFAKVGIDGVSVDSNDLAQLILSIDRNGGRVDEDLGQIDESVMWCLQRVGEEGRENGLMVGICGDEPINHPDLAEKLVELGYSYISVDPEHIDKVRGHVAEAERKLVSKRKGG